ncbi:low molecular weight protein-tyrosine-phosphatase [Haladaptatus salinisoli]|uniref:low molecular weight protein-tyrosine-phosphatase n=1 Tax=Haladaptatus salinisoli TaxID=2884876 RepID=UPI001D0B5569|nr:low molecular weight protein-tyrosine-phosphatase [Haladaptatus salinisoli]
MLHHLRQGGRRLAVEMERLRLRSDSPARDARAAVRRLPPEPTVTFLCLGNICRSPLAERYFEARLSTAECDCATVRSAGFIEKEGRSSPDAAVSVADELGVDLTDHRSRCVDADLLRESDLVLLMDARNYRHLKGKFPDELDKACFLKSFAADGGFEIEDPYSADEATFRRVYGEVTDSVDGLVDALEER